VLAAQLQVRLSFIQVAGSKNKGYLKSQ
jgi:hypothetical protein